MKKNRNVILVGLLICAVFSCVGEQKSNKRTNEIFGTYIFEFPSNEIEVLIIKNDSTFEQLIYKDVQDFNNKSKSQYMNTGEWSVSKNNGLNFKDWLVYCYLRNPDSILSQPEYTFMSDVYWKKPTKKNNGFISIYDENGYVFQHISDWIRDPSYR